MTGEAEKRSSGASTVFLGATIAVKLTEFLGVLSVLCGRPNTPLVFEYHGSKLKV